MTSKPVRLNMDDQELPTLTYINKRDFVHRQRPVTSICTGSPNPVFSGSEIIVQLVKNTTLKT
jgi:hypothetical protein